jgi:hypothetical protein
MSRIRTIVFATLLAAGVTAAPVLVAPALAQIMPEQGIPLPWFRSRSEEIQRDACRRNLPECRATVRAQMDLEQSITVILPWAALGVAVLGVLFYLRAQEKKRERKKKLARMHHTPGSIKKRENERQARRDEDEDDEADRGRMAS